MSLNPLRLGQVKPQGWTLALMRRDFESGFVGHLDKLVPELSTDHKENASGFLWRDGWLRYAILVGEGKGRLLARAWVNRILATLDTEGELWTQTTLFRALLGYYEATGESRVLEAVVQLTGDPGYRAYAAGLYGSDGGSPVSGAPLGETGHEFCSTVEHFDSYAALLRQTGDRVWADKMEHLLFNAALGARHPVHQQTALCCVSNAGHIFPSFVGHQVLADPQGLRIALYGPALVKTEFNGQTLALEMETDYPADLTVELRLYPEVPLEFSLFLRIPEWAEGTLVTGDGASAGEMTDRDGWLELRRTWNRGDSLSVVFEAKIEAHRDHRGQTWFTRGPLVWTLPLADQEEGSQTWGFGAFRELELSPAEPSEWSLAPGDADQALWSDGAVEVPLVAPDGVRAVKKLVPLHQTLLRRVTFPEAAP